MQEVGPTIFGSSARARERHFESIELCLLRHVEVSEDTIGRFSCERDFPCRFHHARVVVIRHVHIAGIPSVCPSAPRVGAARA